MYFFFIILVRAGCKITYFATVNFLLTPYFTPIMTVQLQEKLVYRNRNFLLIGAPLNPFLEARKDIKFGMFTSDNWSGYRGHWLLKDDKLYLTRLESDAYNLNEIFKTREPVVADWFTGILEFGIGDFRADDWWGSYEKYVWLMIKNGEVVEKKIIKRFDDEVLIDFGKYKGRKLEEVLFGKIKDNAHVAISKFIECLMEYLTDRDFELKVVCPNFPFNDEDVKLVKEIRENGIEYFLTNDYLATKTKDSWQHSKNDSTAERLSILVEKILSSYFTDLVTLTRDSMRPTAKVAEPSLLINPDVNYLNWALANVESFSVNCIFLKTRFNLKKLETFRIKRLNKTVFEYYPIWQNEDYQFPEMLQTTNQTKFEHKHRVKYNAEYDFFIPTLTDSEMMQLYGFYLDENFKSESDVGENTEEDEAGFDDDYYDNYYESNDWLRDAAGTDDPDSMNDAYWNID